MLARFAATVADANDRIADLVEADYALEGMGTTVTGAVFDGSGSGWRTSATAGPTCCGTGASSG